LYFIFI